MRIKSPFSKKQKGFTLIEIIIGIVVLSISLAIVSTLIAPTEEQSADNLLQIKAAELGQSYLNDITSRAFDHKSDMAGGRFRCNDVGRTACTPANRFGPEDGQDDRDDEGEDDRSLFNDVDDFDQYNVNSDAIDDALHSGYNNFDIFVSVQYAGDDLGLANNELAKRITVTVTTPLGTPIEFTTYKANF